MSVYGVGFSDIADDIVDCFRYSIACRGYYRLLFKYKKGPETAAIKGWSGNWDRVFDLEYRLSTVRVPIIIIIVLI